MITKVPDTRLGETVVLLTTATDVEPLRAVCQQVLPPYWRPRYFFTTAQLPMTPTGKPARAEAERIARTNCP